MTREANILGSLFSCPLSAFALLLVYVCCVEYSLPGVSKSAEKEFRRMCMRRMFTAMHLFMGVLCCGFCYMALSIAPSELLVSVIQCYALSVGLLVFEQVALGVEWEGDESEEAVTCKVDVESGVCEPLLSGQEYV